MRWATPSVELSDCGVLSEDTRKIYLCGLKTGQSSPYQLQIPKPVTEHRNIYFTNIALLTCYQYYKTQERSLISQCIFKNPERCFKVKAESTYMQHKETTQYFTAAVDTEQKSHWQQHQKNRALDTQAGGHLGIRAERLVQQRWLKPWRKPWLVFRGKKSSLNFNVLN